MENAKLIIEEIFDIINDVIDEIKAIIEKIMPKDAE